MENHSDRPEIKEAAISGVGMSIRRSNTLKKDLFYLAVSITQNSREGFLRLSIPLHDVENAMDTIRIRIIIASLAVSLVVIVFGLIQVRRITKSIEEITDFSKDVAAGNFKRRLLLAGKDELGELGKNISNMARELHERLTLSEEEKRRFEAILKNMSDGLYPDRHKGEDYPRERCPEESLRHPALHRGQDSHGSPEKSRTHGSHRGSRRKQGKNIARD